jgi:hypothetical protein
METIIAAIATFTTTELFANQANLVNNDSVCLFYNKSSKNTHQDISLDLN